MISVTFEHDGSAIGLSVKGHAGQADAGKDIVCSASSILAYTIAQTVNDMYTAGRLLREPEIQLESGRASIVCHPRKEAYSEAMQSFLVIRNGYRLLSTHFPKYVSFGETAGS